MDSAAQKVSNRYAQILAKNTFDTVVDLGCASGELLSQINAKVKIGVDFDPIQLKAAEKKGIKTYQLDFNKEILPFEAESIDLFLCNDVFEHLIEPHKLLSMIYSSLKQGGFLLCHVPNEFRMQNVFSILRGKGFQNAFEGSEHWNYPHLRFFTHASFKQFLERSGFKVLADHTIKQRLWHRLGSLFWWGPTFLCKKC